jgi:hypothetical protein
MSHLLGVQRRLFLAEAPMEKDKRRKMLEMYQNGRNGWKLSFILTLYKNKPAVTFLLLR